MGRGRMLSIPIALFMLIISLFKDIGEIWKRRP
jgi:hypothetical protein